MVSVESGGLNLPLSLRESHINFSVATCLLKTANPSWYGSRVGIFALILICTVGTRGHALMRCLLHVAPALHTGWGLGPSSRRRGGCAQVRRSV